MAPGRITRLMVKGVGVILSGEGGPFLCAYIRGVEGANRARPLLMLNEIGVEPGSRFSIRSVRGDSGECQEVIAW